MTYLSSRVEFELMISCLIIHGLNKAIHYHEKTYSLKCLEITGSDAGPHKKWAVSLVITDTFVFFGTFCGYV